MLIQALPNIVVTIVVIFVLTTVTVTSMPAMLERLVAVSIMTVFKTSQSFIIN